MHPPSHSEIVEADSCAQARRRQPWRVLLIFLAVFFALQYAWDGDVPMPPWALLLLGADLHMVMRRRLA